MAQYKVYSCNDLSAPILTGTTGSLVYLLNSILVTGYGNKTAAGWTADYTASFNSGSTFRPPSGSRMYLNVRDDGIVTTKEARVTGYETMVSFGSGSQTFPISGSQGVSNLGYLIVRKSATADTTPRVWIAFADAYTLILFTLTADTTTLTNILYFGDIYSYKGTDDVYRCLLHARSSENSTGADSFDTYTVTPNVTANDFMARNIGGEGSSVAVGKAGLYHLGGSGYMVGNIAYPNPAGGGVILNPVLITDADNIVRGKYRGIYQLNHAISLFTLGEIVTGANELKNKKFVAIPYLGGGSGNGAIDISDSLDTNT